MIMASGGFRRAGPAQLYLVEGHLQGQIITVVLYSNNVCVYIYIYISYIKYCTPEIDTSEIIVELKWHFPMDFQWHGPI